MKNRKTALALILMTVLAITVYAQQYDLESDFTVRRIRVSRNSKIEDELGITAYLGDKTDVRIPPRIQNLPVSRFSKDAFPDDTTSIVLPNSFTGIWNEAFKGFADLKSITIPNSVTKNESNTFNGCTSLTSITFEDTNFYSMNFNDDAFDGDLKVKFYATDSEKGTPGTYTTTAPVGMESVWTKQ